ncbi:28S ribosomal protein S29, mitochondrial-like [Rhincodon typus]|uniref:28S ribosomal protein S29, mitochondrial-like n=1 Tax=Rhincodon typus TaxID=259920 RepID=UPI00202EDBA3|nr:28S ribosomal protein S29, mitochondrial-like [Rhincodon typus]XP_048476415.1 28S ribosomal protein S29, mitochondrial-like [Rhincodon typus]
MLLKSLLFIARPGRPVNHGRLFHWGPNMWERCAQAQTLSAATRAVSVFRTGEMDPGLHNDQHEGLHYTISPSDLKTVFPHGLTRRFQKQVKTFNEACVMVRRPALELLAYLKAANYSHPVIRYVVCILFWVS